MKKVLAFLTALTALFCTACDNKQDNSSEKPPVGDVTATTSAADISENTDENKGNSEDTTDISGGTEESNVDSEDTSKDKDNPDASEENSDISEPASQLKQYIHEDFKKIAVNLNKQETAPPVEFKEYDLTGIEFKAKKSPCTLPENVKIENICPSSENMAGQLHMDHEEYCQQFLDFCEPILEAENKPLILYTAFDGENLYYLADYDIPCPRVSHDFEIFRYNPETKENACIYEYSNGTEGITIADMTYFDNSLWLITVDTVENTPEIKTYRIDETSGKMNEDIFEKEINLDFFADIHSNGYKSISAISYSGESDIRMEKENRKMTAYTDKIKLETGINKCTPILSTDKRMCFLQADSDVAILHTFDFEKMEKYTTEFETADANRAYQLGNNVLVHYIGSQKCMYFIPELGAGFILQDVERTTSPIGTQCFANDSSVSVYNNKLALTNFDIGMYRDFYYNNTLLRDIYPPVDKDPLQKLYIFDTN